MKRGLLFFLFLFSVTFLFAQGGEIRGTIKDAATGETVVGASIFVAEGKSATTDINGNFSIAVEPGEYSVKISYVGFESQTQKVRVEGAPVNITVSLTTKTLSEIEVVADVAKTRETPVAFSNITSQQIAEELGTRDLPMILNTTPGVYATEQGGGSGDARVSVRGFDQRYVAVMVDGVPVNDMENGAVYWSNWDGLGDIVKTTQVQRGLGASKLAIISVGGTINLITQGIDQKMNAYVKQEVNDYGLYKTSLGFNSGQLKGGWGITLGGSRKWGSAWADQTFVDAWSYFLKIQKRYKHHLFSLSGNGAPQKHGQRTSSLPIAVYNKEFAESLGINTAAAYDSISSYSSLYYTTPTQGERGLSYNPNWGEMNGKPFQEKINYFHKPAINFSHFWTPNEKLTVSTILYLSIGNGGGTGFKTTTGVGRDTANGQWALESIYNYNTTAYSPTYSTTEHPASNYLRASNNNHLWYGLLSTWNYKINDKLSYFVGVDGRYYKGTHYQSVYDLMGADYAIEFPSISSVQPLKPIAGDLNQPTGSYAGDPNLQYAVKRVGDKVNYYNDAEVMWAGLFGQVEYKKNNWSTFITASASETGYQRIDHFKRKDLVIDGFTFEQAVGFKDILFFNGTDQIVAYKGAVVTTSGDTTFVDNPGSGPVLSIVNATPYTNQSAEARVATTKQKWFLGYTLKAGANYNFDDHHNAFVNLGYLNMAPRMNAVFDNNNKEYAQIENQKVYAVEGGYGLKHSQYAATLNLYYTYWQNKPLSVSVLNPDGTRITYNINGLNALHTGAELDFTYKILKNLSFDGLVSIGDWKTRSGSVVYLENENNVVTDTVDFSAKNVHVGDAAQMQYGASLRYEPLKGLYIKPRLTYFAKNYANFDPLTLQDENKDRESWKMPDYLLFDIYAGYSFKYWKMNFGLSAGMTNVLNTIYITDAQNGAGFDAASANVFMGMGRRFNLGLRIGF